MGFRFLLFAGVLDKQTGELLFQRLNFRPVAHQNVWISGIVQGVVLVVVLSAIERLEGCHLGDDWACKRMCEIQLRNVSLGNSLLVITLKKDGRAIGCAYVGGD